MTPTCFIAGTSAVLACLLFGIGFFRIACNLDGPVVCMTCCAIGGAEICGGALIWAGLLAIMGGYL